MIEVLLTAVQQLLISFDALPEPEQQQAAMEILRRVAAPMTGDLSDAALVEAAEELFLSLDAEEAHSGVCDAQQVLTVPQVKRCERLAIGLRTS